MKYFSIIFCLILPLLVLGQGEQDNKNTILNLGFDYSFQIPGGDLKDRFGGSTGLGGKIEFLLKNNFSISGDGFFFFGRNVKEDPIASLRGRDGLFIATNFSQANIFLRERGFYMGGSIGKIFPVLKNNKRSGIKIDLGVGLFQHKIRIQDDPEAFVPIIANEYKKGFDRLSNGLALRQFVGYQHLSNNRLINFYVGFEFVQAFTQNRRSINFDTMASDDTRRFDLLSAFKIGWILPFYLGEKGEEIYY